MALVERIRSWVSGFSAVDTAPEAAEEPGALTPEAFTAITGFPVGDLSVYVQSMRHRSLLRGQLDSGVESNERLEFLGDAVLGFVTAEHLYRVYPGQDEGFLTRLRAKLVNGKALAARATALGLDELIMVSENLRQQGQTQQFTSIMADAFEALIGALYLDQGTEAVSTFIVETMLEPLDLDELMSIEDNPKSLLLEFAQARGWSQPVYRVQEATGPSHLRQFTVEVVVREESLGTGQAGSKKQAEQRAARVALELLRRTDGQD